MFGLFKRKAGDVFKKQDALQEKADILYHPGFGVGEGAFGQVYEGLTPGTVVKTIKENEFETPKEFAEEMLEFAEADVAREMYAQQLLASRGQAPPVYRVGRSSLSDFPVIEMKDMRDNYQTARALYGDDLPRSVRVRTQQQVGQMALMGIKETDRNSGNILINDTTGKPLQIDYGSSDEVGRGSLKQITTLKNATADGLAAAGLIEEAKIYNGLVSELMIKGDLPAAFDMAKQGFSRLQKIDAATLKDGVTLNINASSPLEGEATKRRILQELADEGFFN